MAYGSFLYCASNTVRNSAILLAFCLFIYTSIIFKSFDMIKSASVSDITSSTVVSL
ncbi:MAG: hypothetical protein ACI8WT_000397 [Clostridium sp.]|jgi:hypothetical protein